MGSNSIFISLKEMMKRVRLILIAIFILYPVFIFADERDLSIHFIDVGEGESVLIKTSKGKAILIDSGNCITGFRVTEYLKKNNIYTLDHLIFTHLDLDHICGAFFALQILKAKNIYDNGQDLSKEEKSSDIYRWYDELVRKDKNYQTLRVKDAIFLDGVTLRVLWPSTPFPSGDYNANSLVMMLEYGRFRCLLTADLTIAGERKILALGENLKAEVLKIGHHGASDATSEEFLTSVSPKIAIISVNKANIRGSAAWEVLQRLKQAKVNLFRTDEDGDIVLSVHQSKDKEFKIEVNKAQ